MAGQLRTARFDRAGRPSAVRDGGADECRDAAGWSIPFTQQQIADITGQTSVNVNRVLADMERQGLIRRKGRDIQFIDWAEMRRVGSFQPATWTSEELEWLASRSCSEAWWAR